MVILFTIFRSNRATSRNHPLPRFYRGTEWIDHYKSGKVMSRNFIEMRNAEFGMRKKTVVDTDKHSAQSRNQRNHPPPLPQEVRVGDAIRTSPPAGLFFGSQLKGKGQGFFAATGAADIEIFEVCGHGNFRLQEVLLERESTAADEFGFEHGSCVPAKKWVP
jgi:hypothetical protein